MIKYTPLLLSVLLILGCTSDDDAGMDNTSSTPNILLIIADDIGKDAIAGFVEGNIKPNTPNLDNLRNTGLVFNNLWVYPTCSPTRASIITGKYGYRTGVKWAGDELGTSEMTLQQYINNETDDDYATAIVGKWHLSGEDATINPESFGIDYYAGLIRGGVQDYYRWQLTEDGESSLQTTYSTAAFTDLSIEWINDQTQPWFLWLAYNAPHTPFHVPPSEMHEQGILPEYVDGMDPIPYYMAAIEAIDYQIGKLLTGIPETALDNTIIIFLGDNGTPGQAAQLPYTSRRAKGSLYQGGVNVPMFITGSGVGRTGQDNNLITSTDLFSTIAELAGASATEIHDSKSFKSLLSNNSSSRVFQYAEMDNGTDDLWAINDGTYKLIINADGTSEMYHLASDPYESSNLLNSTLTIEEEDAKVALEAELARIRN